MTFEKEDTAANGQIETPIARIGKKTKLFQSVFEIEVSVALAI